MNKSPDSQQDTYLNDYMFLYLYAHIHIKNGVANAILATPLTSSLCISPGLLRDQELLSTHSYDMPPDTHAFTSHCAKIGLKMLLWAEKRSPFLTRVLKQNMPLRQIHEQYFGSQKMLPFCKLPQILLDNRQPYPSIALDDPEEYSILKLRVF